MHLITGGSGFLGSRLARRLLAAGERVRILDLLPPPADLAAAEFVCGNICDPEALRPALGKIEVVHHLAALVPLVAKGGAAAQVNAEGTRVLASLSAGRRLFFVSSSAIFGGSTADGRISRSVCPAPIEAYGESKWKAEQILAGYFPAEKEVTILRPRTLLGPERMGIFSILFDWVTEGRNIYMLGSGENLLQLTHVDDFLDAYLHLWRTNAAGTYNVAGAAPVKLNRLLGALIENAGSRSGLVALPERPSQWALAVLAKLGLSPLAPWHYLSYGKSLYFDETNAIAGWCPKRSVTETLLSTYADYRQRDPGYASGSPHRRKTAEKILGLLRRIS